MNFSPPLRAPYAPLAALLLYLTLLAWAVGDDWPALVAAWCGVPGGGAGNE